MLLTRDAALQALLASIAEHSEDADKRDLLMDYILTVPTLREWPTDARERMRDTCDYVTGLARDLRQKRDS